MANPIIEAEVTFLSPEEGGRKTPLSVADYRPLVALGAREQRRAVVDARATCTEELLGIRFLTGPARIAPGETAIVTLSYFPRKVVDPLSLGATFTIREGASIVGHGKVLRREASDVVERMLLAAVNGPYFPDWEFEVLFGFTRAQMSKIAEEWPNPDASRKRIEAAVGNAFTNLLGYPHGMEAELERAVGVPLPALEEELRKWRASFRAV